MRTPNPCKKSRQVEGGKEKKKKKRQKTQIKLHKPTLENRDEGRETARDKRRAVASDEHRAATSSDEHQAGRSDKQRAAVSDEQWLCFEGGMDCNG